MNGDVREQWGVWLGAIIAATALAGSGYAVILQARQGESASWSIALSRLGELYDCAYENERLAGILLEPTDTQYQLEPRPSRLAPKESIWLSSLFLAYEQIYVATLSLSSESQRVWRLYLGNQLNKPTIRAAFVTDAGHAKDFHRDFWQFVRGHKHRETYEGFIIHPKYFRRNHEKKEIDPLKLGGLVSKPYVSEHSKFWTTLYHDEDVKKQMYAIRGESEKEINKNLSNRIAFTVFLGNEPVGGFTITQEPPPFGKIASFGILLSREFRGRHLSSQILDLLQKRAKELGVLTLRADVYNDNYPCLNALKTSGFREFIWFEKNIDDRS